MEAIIKIRSILILICACVISYIASEEMLEMRNPDIIIPSDGLTYKRKLSDYLEPLLKTNGNSDIYFFEGSEPGANVLVLGGTHPNEPAGFISAVIMIENVKVRKGKLIIIPQACLSGFTTTDPLEGSPQEFFINTKTAKRKFRFGSRVTNPIDQWPDPLVYLHYPSKQKLSGFETRNLNRAYPGRPNGTFTEKVAYAIVQVIQKENVNIAFDLHEAAPEIPIINAIVSHEKGKEIAATAVFNLEFNGFQYALELSPTNFKGLSHREWGDATNVIPFLTETSNPIQGRLRGITNQDLIINGVDKFYSKALELGRLRITYKTEGEPLAHRVGRHLEAFIEIVKAYNEIHQDNTIIIDNLPNYNELINKGIGKFLN